MNGQLAEGGQSLPEAAQQRLAEVDLPACRQEKIRAAFDQRYHRDDCQPQSRGEDADRLHEEHWELAGGDFALMLLLDFAYQRFDLRPVPAGLLAQLQDQVLGIVELAQVADDIVRDLAFVHSLIISKNPLGTPGCFLVIESERQSILGGFMKASQLRARYLRIIFFFGRVTAGFIFWELALPRLGLSVFTRSTRSRRLKGVAAQFRALAVRMGGVMIKVGQFLSSRLDVLPPEITAELAGLQDEVPPEDFADIRRLAEAELGGSLGDKFESFDPSPLAAASLGQVHRARICKGTGTNQPFCNVVVKVQRPDIDALIEVDLRAIRVVGGWLEHYRPVRERADVKALIGEFSDTIREEVDYLAEGKNAERFAEHFKDVSRVHVPRVVWSLTTRRVLVLEDVFAIKITDYEAITAAGIDRGEVARQLLDTYLKQIFEDGFFHADPHPGNLFVTPLDGKNEEGPRPWRLTFVDFGMVGHVPDDLRDGLRGMLVAVGTQDAARLVRSFQTLHVLLPSADLLQIEQMSAQIFDMFWGKSMDELRKLSPQEMFRFADRFRGLMYSMPFQLPQNLLMLGRTVAILSGMCTGLDKDFNLWNQLAPYATKLVSQEVGSNWRVWLDELGNIVKELIALPAKLGRALSQVERGDLTVQSPQLSRQIQHLERAVDRATGGMIFAAFLLGSVFLYNAGELLPAGVFLGISGVILIWIVFFNRGRHMRP
jgi:predicted unusual protein kinase regulating ubiquinone biosynthesis (AarF/ABC1/UbiB family)